MKLNLFRLLYLRMIGKTKEEAEPLLLDPNDKGDFLICPDTGFCFEDL